MPGLVTLAVVFALLTVSVPAAGGKLARLGDVRLNRVWLAFAALTLQVLIVTVFPSGSHGLYAAIHLLSYVLAAGFVVSNLGVPWMWLAATGGAMNAAGSSPTAG